VAATLYSYNVDLQQLNSHSLAVLSVRPGSRVLDLGAADGSVARALKARGCAVWGVEQDKQAAEVAREICDRVVTADLESEEVWSALEGETFDVIFALDVLEHLRQPAPVLRRASRHLNPAGIVVVSLPNVTHGALRLNLLRGHFEYTPVGLLDRTHLRFFDRRSAEQLMADGGLVISERLRVKRGLNETEIPVAQDEIPPAFIEMIERDPDATTYQFVFVARRADVDAPASTSAMLTDRLLAENEALRAQLVAQRAENEALRAQLVAQRAENEALREQLLREKAMAEDLVAQRDGLAHHQQDLETSLAASRAYSNSAGFWLVEQVSVSLKRVPQLYRPLRALVRTVAGRWKAR
jgi:2-polyprenyl-3-methyl-5-hydroxy-6-metoxy-1,4-benzoquinol methylase